MNDIEIFGRHTSYNVQKVLWLADELGLRYSHTEIGGRFGGNNEPEFLSMNPQGKVPVIRHQSNVIWESNTIVRYLADCFSHGDWISSDPYIRSLSDRWMDWSIDRLEPAFVGVFWGFYRTPQDQQNQVAIQASIDECDNCLVILSQHLENKKFLLGNRPTVADVATGVFLYRLFSIGLELKTPSNVKNWFEKLAERDAYKRWVMSDFSELHGRMSY